VSIYLLIGGTFAPVLLVYLGGTLGVTLFCVQWGVILLGVTAVAVLGPGRWRPLHYTLYFLIGWSGLMFIPDFWQNNRLLLWFILLGGIAYTLGMIPFARSKKYDHCVWHLFVLAGAALQWLEAAVGTSHGSFFLRTEEITWCRRSGRRRHPDPARCSRAR